MIKNISLENYKSFKNETNIEIFPLTILCGVNSSGKSSILKSLLMLKQSFEESNVYNGMLLNGKYIDNGTYNEILNSKSKEDSFTISNAFVLTKNKSAESKEYNIFKTLSRLYHKKEIEKIEINYKITITHGSGSLYSNQIKNIDLKINVFVSSTIIASSINMSLKDKKKYKILGHNIPDTSTGNLGSVLIDDCFCYFSNMSLNSIYKEKIEYQNTMYIPSLVSLFNVVPTQYAQIYYIAPLRENPARRYISDRDVVNVGIAGENTSLLLNSLYKKTKSSVCAPSSEDDYIASSSNFEKTNFMNILNSWMEYMDLGTINIETMQNELIKIKSDNQNLADVGFGVSQGLPILVEGLSLYSNQVLLLEQPEIHLHPRAQMKMADFLLSLIAHDKTVIVETHSDHFINRIVRRYMEDENIRDKIRIYFIDKDSDGLSSITPIRIDEVDGAICDNENFFYQFANETSRIIDIGYRNLQKRLNETEN